APEMRVFSKEKIQSACLTLCALGSFTEKRRAVACPELIKRESHGKSSQPVATSEPLLCPRDGRRGFALPDARPCGNPARALAAEAAGAGRG
ncbi:ClpV1 family type VI secretion ATPase, partial [Klebsiella michiganensis]